MITDESNIWGSRILICLKLKVSCESKHPRSRKCVSVLYHQNFVKWLQSPLSICLSGALSISHFSLLLEFFPLDEVAGMLVKPMKPPKVVVLGSVSGFFPVVASFFFTVFFFLIFLLSDFGFGFPPFLVVVAVPVFLPPRPCLDCAF